LCCLLWKFFSKYSISKCNHLMGWTPLFPVGIIWVISPAFHKYNYCNYCPSNRLIDYQNTKQMLQIWTLRCDALLILPNKVVYSIAQCLIECERQ
jgi:hypothetical protein